MGLRGAWNIEHKKPISRGGSNNFRNLVPAYFNCNYVKGDMTASEFKKVITNPEENTGLPWAEIVSGAIVGGVLGGLKVALEWLYRHSVLWTA